LGAGSGARVRARLGQVDTARVSSATCGRCGGVLRRCAARRAGAWLARAPYARQDVPRRLALAVAEPGRLSRVARGASDPEELLLVGFFLEQLGARLERVVELRLGDEEHVLGELFLARQALAQLRQSLGVGHGGLCRRRAGGDEAYVVVLALELADL